MKKALKWVGIVLLSPLLLFVIIATLLYVPPIQNWLVQRVAAYASEQTGMDISVEHVRLRFPLDLDIGGVLVVEQGDTIADIQSAVADIRLMPLFSGKVVIDQLQLDNAKVNTKSFIADMRMKGTIGQLAFTSPGIELAKMDMKLVRPRLSDSHLTVFMSDTAAVDTSTTGWHIAFDSFAIESTQINVVLDSAAVFAHTATRIGTYFGKANIRGGDIHLGLGRYAMASLDWKDGALTYGSDTRIAALQLGIDSLFSYKERMSLTIRHGSAAGIRTPMTPKGELALTELHGSMAMDGERLAVKNFTAKTPNSTLEAQADMAFADMTALHATAKDNGQNNIRISAQLGRSDLALLTPELTKNAWPDYPLTLNASVKGTLANLNIEQIDAMLPTAFHFKGNGRAANVNDTKNLVAKLAMELDTYGQLTPLLHQLGLPADYRVPAGMNVAGTLGMNGKQLDATIAVSDGHGSARLKATTTGMMDNVERMAYDADITATNIDLRRYMPGGPIGRITAKAQVKGRGFDPFDRSTQMDATAHIQRLDYDEWSLDSVSLKATVDNGMARITSTSVNRLLNGSFDLEAELKGQRSTNQLAAKLNTDMTRIDLHALGLTDSPMALGLRGTLDIDSDMELAHSLTANISSIYISDSVGTRRLDDVALNIITRSDTVSVRMNTADFMASLNARGNYEQLMSNVVELSDTLMAQAKKRSIDQQLLKDMLPTAHLIIAGKGDTPVMDMINQYTGIGFDNLDIDLDSSPITGLNGRANIMALTAGTTRLDTIVLSLHDKGRGLGFNGHVANNKKNDLGAFRLLYDGQVRDYGAMFGLRYYDERGLLNVRIGAKAEMAQLPTGVEGETDSGLRFQLVPSRPTLGYKEFSLNEDNYLLLHDNQRIEANIDLQADDGTRIMVYTENNDGAWTLGEKPLQDITISVHKLDLGSLSSNIAFLPDIKGVLNGDYHLIMDAQHNISVASDMTVDKMAYEGSPIGNIGTEFVYLLREDDTHVVDATLMLEDEEIGTLRGSYSADGRLDGKMTLTSMPLSIANGFMPDQMFGFEGTASGTLTVDGPMNALSANGTVNFDDGYFVSKPYGVRMKFGDRPVSISNSVLMFNKFTLYSYNDNPLTINGNVDLRGEYPRAIRLLLDAKDFQLINAKQTRESVAYGKAFVNFVAVLSGNLSRLSLRGRLDVLGTTDLNYIMLDSPLSTDNQMDELVRFVDFSDSSSVVTERPEADFLDLNMNISIDHGAQLRCALNADETNYVNLQGGGELRMSMNADGMNLMGRYTVERGSMKYSLPVIPLKTFTIKEGSYVEFTGQPDNPTLNITATESNRATVTQADEQTRSVAFECGVVITRTLADMGLEFTISAPEDMQVQNELAAMGTEQRGKIAVTMLTTGMYLADGNTGAFSMNSALSSFLQNEINNITAGALKTVDLQLGLDNSTSSTGETRTDYSFKFAKRFWNNRLNVQIGGKVSTGAEIEGQQQSFFDNVSMEYRLSPTSNQYVKLFYNQNFYDWLEGYTGEYGGGYIWKRKLDSLWPHKESNDSIKTPQQYEKKK